MTTMAPMSSSEYQTLIEEIGQCAKDLETLGETRTEWSDEDQDHWDDLDARYQELEQRKNDEDKLRQDALVAERLTSLKRSSRATKKIPMTRSVRRDLCKTPTCNVPLRAFRDADTAYDVGLWIKGNVLKDKQSRELLEARNPEFRVQTEGVSSAGGYTVPDPLSSTIIEVLNEVSVAMRVCDVVPMTSDTMSIPVLSTGQTVYYPNEGSAVSLSDTAWGQVALTAVKRATLTKVSNELIADSVISMADRIARRAAYELAYQMDNEFINGDGTSTYGAETGLITAVAAGSTFTAGSGDDTWAELVLQDFHETLGKLVDAYWVDANLYWIMRRDFYATAVQRLMYAAGGNTTENIQAGTGPTLFGYPIAFTARMPAEAQSTFGAFFGNFSEAVVLGNRDEVSIASSEQYAFNEDVTTIRTTHRYDINVHQTAAYVGLKLGAT